MKQATQRKLKTLTREYRLALPAKVIAIEVLWAQYRQHPEDIYALETLYEYCHRLAGSGGTFGCEDISNLARDIEMLVAELIRPAPGASTPSPDSIQALIEALGQACEANLPTETGEAC